MRSGILIALLCLIVEQTASPAGEASRSASTHGGKAGSRISSPATKTKPRRNLTEKDALRIVTNRPEVKKWKHAVDAAKARKVSAIIEVDREEDGAFVVHVYEMVPDVGDTGHSATFNWYHVNKRTGKVTAEF